jgi:hypothetical protein
LRNRCCSLIRTRSWRSIAGFLISSAAYPVSETRERWIPPFWHLPTGSIYEEANLATCAATYAFHLTQNHPFLDGNKRIGAAVAEIFVRLNSARLAASNDEIVELFLGIASGKCSREEVEQIFGRWVIHP